MRKQKLVLDLSVDQIPPEKINKMFLPKKLGFIDVLSTVYKCSEIFRDFYQFPMLRKTLGLEIIK